MNKNLLSPLTPRNTATSITITSPNKARSSTINQLHNKLEYERQIQDKLLLEQQKEIESLQSDLDKINLNSTQLNVNLNEKQNELTAITQQLIHVENKYAELIT